MSHNHVNLAPGRNICRQWRWCPISGKRRWGTRGRAKREAKRLQRRDGAPCSAFYCRDCQGFHCGHSPYWVRARKESPPLPWEGS